ncbi:MAG: TetR/AcrR family transcriptional regulator [Hyphomonadaceae bacterium]|nr:TetR/AcrR family transcriptional regulator [Hyphomonadaceae bacterium]
MKSNLANTDDKQRSYGRPRLLTHDEILDSAVALGLEGLSMKRLATSLNVGTATLYQYFDSRKTLMRAAAVHALSDVELPKDIDQHWTTYASEFAGSLIDILAENPSYIHSNQHSDYGFEVQFKLVEQFLSVMNKRGFAPEDGMRVFNIVGTAAFAGATETVRQREFEVDGEKMADVAQRQFNRLSSGEFPMMSQAISAFTATPQDKIKALLTAAFATIARERGDNPDDIKLKL